MYVLQDPPSMIAMAMKAYGRGGGALLAIALAMVVIDPAASQFIEVEPRVQIISATQEHRLVRSTVRNLLCKHALPPARKLAYKTK